MTPLPASGASIGEMLMTSITSAMIRAASAPVAVSRITARGTTISTEPPIPCTKRAAISQPMDGASVQRSVPTMNTPRPMMSGALRPI